MKGIIILLIMGGRGLSLNCFGNSNFVFFDFDVIEILFFLYYNSLYNLFIDTYRSLL